MRRDIASESLRAGMCLPGTLCDAQGRVLIPAGVWLTESDLTMARRHARYGLCAGKDWPDEPTETPTLSHLSTILGPSHDAGATTDIVGESSSPSASPPVSLTVPVDALRLGMRLSQDLYDEQGLLLLRAGKRITPRFMGLLRQRNTRSVCTPALSPQHIEVLREQCARQLDDFLIGALRKPQKFRPVGVSARPRLALEDLADEAERGREARDAAAHDLGELFEDLQDRPQSTCGQLRATVDAFVGMITLDFDLLPTIVGIQRATDEYLFDHCMNTSLLSMAIAAQLGLSRQAVTEIGLGALLQDVGMLLVPEEIRLAPRVLTPDEWLEVERHPIHTIDYLEGVQSLPTTVKLIGYQCHERDDASGYPRRRAGMLIHQYAKIVAVADTYAAMTRVRPHRHPMLPYEAVTTLLAQGAHSKFDRTIIRALLDCLSLFPIGSYVELNDGTRGKVIRAAPGQHTRPVITEVDLHFNPTGRVIDLAAEAGLGVRFALHPPIHLAERKPALIVP